MCSAKVSDSIANKLCQMADIDYKYCKQIHFEPKKWLSPLTDIKDCVGNVKRPKFTLERALSHDEYDLVIFFSCKTASTIYTGDFRKVVCVLGGYDNESKRAALCTHAHLTHFNKEQKFEFTQTTEWKFIYALEYVITTYIPKNIAIVTFGLDEAKIHSKFLQTMMTLIWNVAKTNGQKSQPNISICAPRPYYAGSLQGNWFLGRGDPLSKGV